MKSSFGGHIIPHAACTTSMLVRICSVEDFARVEPPITVLVFENEDEIAQVEISNFSRFSVKCNSRRPTSARAFHAIQWGSAHPARRQRTLALKPVAIAILAAASERASVPYLSGSEVVPVGELSATQADPNVSSKKHRRFHNADFSSGGEAAQ